MASTRRKHLNDFKDATRDIELAEQAIQTLERISSSAAVNRCIKALKAQQQRYLVAIDKAAEKLGAPYGS